MKTFALFSLVALGLSVPAFAQIGGMRATDFEIKKVQPSVVKTPDFQYTGDQRRSKPSPWLEIEVEFSAKPEFTDELTFKYYAAIKGPKGVTVLSGEVTHVNIPKGRELHSVMYVAPRTLERLLDNHPLTAAAIENVGVQMLAKGQLLGEESFQKAGAQWWARSQQVTGFLLNKNQTPFAPLYWDRYEAIRETR